MQPLARVSVILACVLALALPAAGRAQEDWAAWLDKIAGDFSGAVLIARGETVEAARAYGLADRTANRLNTPETRFNLGSINKTFTAIAIAQLIQQGRLTLEDTVARHIPDYPNKDAAGKITVFRLLTHRSGVARFVGGDFGDTASVADMTGRVGSEPMSFEPGARQEYSNGGYVVLGRIVEMASGKDYATYVSDNVYRPAGMTNTVFARKGETDPSFALSVRPLRPGNPAGGGYSTVSDLFKFSRALRTGRLLDRRMTEYVMTGTFSEQPGPKFGFALREQVAGTRRFIGNGGGAPGVNAEFRFEPAGDYTVAVLANSSPPAATRMMTEILNRLGSRASAK